ncbi:MAG: hypothetical protein LAT51_13050 [Flavobacteriaceae bacterium]|nr:hypothetical protein [Flavobacteriaceae bacterium]
MDELLPYQGVEVIQVTRSSELIHSQGHPAEVVHLISFLKAELNEPIMIDELVRSSTGTMSLNIGQRLILLHIATDRLFEYDLETGESIDLGQFGRGPGDVAFVVDMTLKDSKLYLTREDFTISVFDCSIQPCMYSYTIPTTTMGISVAPMNDTFAVLGRNIRGRTEDSIHIYNVDGELLNSFGDLYRVSNQYLQSVMMQGMIRSQQEHKLFLKTYAFLPYIYVLKETGEIHHIFQFKDFFQPITEHNRNSGNINTTPTGDISILSETERGSFIVQVRFNKHFAEPSDYDFDKLYDFYLVDVNTGDYSYIGQYNHKGEEDLSIQVNRLGVVVNEGGEFRFYKG